MEITIRSVKETDYLQIVALFKDFAAFEKFPEKMTNSVDRMINEKDFFNCFVAETIDNRIVGYVTYFFAIILGLVNLCIWMICMLNLNFE